jgi:UDP-2,3-diacylglucosamine hydrolase
MLRIPRDEPALFASDMHLAPEGAASAERFLDALRRHGSGAGHVFLLGDLFELWVGDDGADPLAGRLASLLAGLAGRGTRVWLMRGNRDFLLDVPVPDAPARQPYSSRCGATMLADPTPIELHGVAALIAHGDALCTDDLEYQRWRDTCRDPAWQQAFLSRPLSDRFAMGRAMRETSEAGKQMQTTALTDVNPDTVNAVMDDADASLLIHGHTHRPAVHRWAHAGGTRRRVVLSDWDTDRGSLLGWRDGEPMALT